MTTTTDKTSTGGAGGKGGPDIRQLNDRDLPKSTFPGEAKVDFRIALDDKIHREIQKHAKENKSVEICGVLVGKWGRDDKGPFVSITASIRGEAATNKFAEVTFTHDTWSKINAEMDKNYSGHSIVGWYHTHPDFGIFLSDRDRFIHEHFFNEPGQVAYVVDPIRDIEGFFIWSGGKAVPSPYYWAGDRIKMSPPEKDPKSSGHENRATSDERAGGRDDYPPEQGVMGWATVVLGGLCLFMLGFMLSNWLVSMDRARLLDTMQNSVGALQIMQRMNLAQKLGAASVNLRVGAMMVDQLARNTAPLNETQRQLATQKVNELIAASGDIDQMQRQFGVTNGELATLTALLAQTQASLENARMTATQPATTMPLSVAPSAPPTTAPAP